MKKKLDQIKQWLYVNRLKVLLGIVVTVVLLVLWINNVKTVNNLILENHRLEVQYKDLISQNEDLRRRLTQMKSPERIIKIAQERAGLILNDEAPVVIIDTSLIKIKENE